MTAGNPEVRKAYASFAPMYDFVFGKLLQPGRRHAIRAMNLKAGDRVLEVGVGTGISLPLYPPEVRVIGIDLSTEMLAKARERVRERGLTNVEDLLEMDATHMSFPDNSFDVVMAMYIISVVDHPERVTAEMVRVCKPGGRLIIVNHFESRHPLMVMWHKLVRPIHRAVAFRSDLNFEQFKARTGLCVERAFRANLFGYSTVVCCRKPA